MPDKLPIDVTKYLNKFAYLKRPLQPETKAQYKMIVCIPAISEFENFKKLSQCLLANDNKFFSKILILTIVNNPASASQEIKADNKKLIDFIKNDLKEKELGFSVIDASTEGNELPDNEAGVGLARKTVCDTALSLFDYGSQGANILLFLDADCVVQDNYLNTVFQSCNNGRLASGYINFRHQKAENEETEKAITCYEIFLRYYVLGLKYAASPYAFHTVGSTIFCDVESYLKVQGMNRKKAGEDFYFMEKLAKITRINKISETTVFPSPRSSFRVPFGTGRSMGKYLESGPDYTLYDPEIFTIIKRWNEVFLSGPAESHEYYLQSAKDINEKLCNFLLNNNFDKTWERIVRTSRSGDQVNKQKNMWFDGFRTLKLVHFLRDNGYPNVQMFKALETMFKLCEIRIDKISSVNGIPDLMEQRIYLDKLRESA